jgi:protein involved in temperature-dependent protein secretion
MFAAHVASSYKTLDLMSTDAEKIREHLNNNKLNEALILARKLARANPSDLKARALLLEVLFTKGEHAAVATELTEMERDKVDHAELQRLRTRFKKR